MKTRKLFSAAFLMSGALAMFSSCSNDEGVLNGGNEEAVQTISLAVANTGDNFLGSRANRPLYSSEANQSIDNVKVVIYKLEGVTDLSNVTEQQKYGNNKTIVAQKLFTPWMNGGVSSLYSDATNGHGRQASWTLATADLIKTPGVYMAYAVGHNTDDYTELTNFNNLAKDGQANFPLSVTVSDGGVKEIFAGSTIFKVEEVSKEGAQTNNPSYHFNAKLVLHRQVAGAIGYFTNIPVKGNADHANANGTKLRLVAAAENNKAVFAGFNSEYTGENGKPSTTNVKYVVNGHSAATTADANFYGSTQNDAHTVYEVTLSDWFTSGDSNGDGLLNENDTWSNKIDAENTTVKVDKGSVLASSFMIPFQYVADKATFQLQMLDENGNIIRYWNIRLPQGNKDSQVGTKVTLVKEDGTTTQEGLKEDGTINYSIVRNHLYNIGVRDNGNDGGGTTDPQPDPDTDKPQDLNDETLILRVNDNWEMIHQMEVD